MLRVRCQRHTARPPDAATVGTSLAGDEPSPQNLVDGQADFDDLAMVRPIVAGAGGGNIQTGTSDVIGGAAINEDASLIRRIDDLERKAAHLGTGGHVKAMQFAIAGNEVHAPVRPVECGGADHADQPSAGVEIIAAGLHACQLRVPYHRAARRIQCVDIAVQGGNIYQIKFSAGG